MHFRLREIMYGLVFGAIGFVLVGCGLESDGRGRILVFAATSLTNVLTEIGELYENETGRTVSFSYSGSQTLAQQIASGAPADLFISAGRFPMDYLIEEEVIDQEVERLLSNSLVAVTRVDEAGIKSINELKTEAVRKVAVADPELAPAGRYAQEALSYLVLWQEIQEKLVYGSDVRVTMTYVTSGNADVGLVYETDARNTKGLKIQRIVPPESYSSIAYLVATVGRSEKKESAAEFTQFLRGNSATVVFRKHGFESIRP